MHTYAAHFINAPVTRWKWLEFEKKSIVGVQSLTLWFSNFTILQAVQPSFSDAIYIFDPTIVTSSSIWFPGGFGRPTQEENMVVVRLVVSVLFTVVSNSGSLVGPEFQYRQLAVRCSVKPCLTCHEITKLCVLEVYHSYIVYSLRIIP